MNKARSWLEGAGLTLLYLLPHLDIVFSASRSTVYHQVMPLTTLMRGTLIDLLVLTAITGAYLFSLKGGGLQARRKTHDILWLPVLCILGWLFARMLIFSTRSARLEAILKSVLPALPWLPLIVIVIAGCILATRPRLYRQITAATSFLLAAAGFACILVVLPRVAWGCWNKQPQEITAFANVPKPSSPAAMSSRIIWVLFDELSYNQAFDHRLPDVHLPAFDALAGQSTVFSQVLPAGEWTEEVVPSLLLGKPVDGIRVNAKGMISWHSAQRDPWQLLDPQQTIFAQAQQLGWSTGVAGWYNPYCRLLAPVLDRCYWIDSYDLEAGFFQYFQNLSSSHSSLQNAFYGLPFAYQLSQKFEDNSPAHDHLYDNSKIEAEGESLIDDPEIRFAFIHLPIPHPPGIYRRPGATESQSADYLDNLVLSDQVLAELRAAIAQTPDAANTTLIVSSDHSWRVPMWRIRPGWTKEEERASDGGFFDQRPVLIVHSPQQTTANRIDAPTNALAVHGLLLDLLSGKSSVELNGQQASSSKGTGAAAN